ncbi:hypothetical protein J6S88_06075 [bacterium]|nr:hypothetical protein [bacterium]
MSGNNIHSVSFYRMMAQAKADLDKNGEINGEEEQSLFNNYLQNFERDGKDGLTEEDVTLYSKEVTFTDEEKEAMRQMDEIMAKDQLTDEDKTTLLALSDKIDFNKKGKTNLFVVNVIKTVMYLGELMKNGNFTKTGLSVEDVEGYQNSYREQYKELLN